MTGIRLHRLAEAFYPDSRHNQEAFFNENIRSFEAAYSLPGGAGTERPREYRWQLADAGARRPMFGFDTDTQHGNSGAPVFSRNDTCVIGVFGGGRPDGVSIAEASWREHEFATPLAAIAADLEVAARGLPTTGGSVDEAKRRELVLAVRAAVQ